MPVDATVTTGAAPEPAVLVGFDGFEEKLADLEIKTRIRKWKMQNVVEM